MPVPVVSPLQPPPTRTSYLVSCLSHWDTTLMNKSTNRCTQLPCPSLVCMSLHTLTEPILARKVATGLMAPLGEQQAAS